MFMLLREATRCLHIASLLNRKKQVCGPDGPHVLLALQQGPLSPWLGESRVWVAQETSVTGPSPSLLQGPAPAVGSSERGKNKNKPHSENRERDIILQSPGEGDNQTVGFCVLFHVRW